MYRNITFATFRKSGNIPLLKDTLIISLNGSESPVLNSFSIFVGILLGPVALFGLMQLIRDSMSAGVVGKRKIVSLVVRPRCDNGFLAFTIFSFNLAATLVKNVLK